MNFPQVAALAALSGRTGSVRVATEKKARNEIQRMYRELRAAEDDMTALGNGVLRVERVKFEEDEHWSYRLSLDLGYLYDDATFIQDEPNEY